MPTEDSEHKGFSAQRRSGDWRDGEREGGRRNLGMPGGGENGRKVCSALVNAADLVLLAKNIAESILFFRTVPLAFESEQIFHKVPLHPIPKGKGNVSHVGLPLQDITAHVFW